jgi:hypothetical protein
VCADRPPNAFALFKACTNAVDLEIWPADSTLGTGETPNSSQAKPVLGKLGLRPPVAGTRCGIVSADLALGEQFPVDHHRTPKFALTAVNCCQSGYAGIP